MKKRNFTRQVSLIVSQETYNQLIEQTNKKEVTVSEWIREAIEERLSGELHFQLPILIALIWGYVMRTRCPY